MKLVMTRYRGHTSLWLVGEKDEGLSAVLRQPAPHINSGLLASWPTREQAQRYVDLILRLSAEHPDKTTEQVRERARQIMAHG